MGLLTQIGIASAAYLLSFLLRRRQEPVDPPETTLRTQETRARWIVGRARTAGVLANAEVSDNGRILLMDILLSEGEIESVEKVWVDEKPYDLSSPGRATPRGESSSPGWRAAVGHSRSGGIAFQVHTDGGSIGIPYVRVAVFSTHYKQVPRLAFLVRGIKINWPGQTDPTFTNNAAAIRWWWLTQRRGIDANLIDEQSVRDAIARCGATVNVDLAGQPGLERFLDVPDTPEGATPSGWVNTLPTASSGEVIWWSGSTVATVVEEEPTGSTDTETTTWSEPRPYDDNNPPTGYGSIIYQTGSSTYSQPRFTVNGVIEAGEDVAGVEADMDFAWQGTAPQVDGLINFIPGEDRTPSITVGKGSITLSVQTAKRMADRINSIDLQLNQSWEKEWQRHTLATFADTALITRDGRTFKRELQVRFVPDAVAARRLGAIFLRRLRPDRKWLVVDPPAPAKSRAAPGDHVTIDPQALGGNTLVGQVERARLRDDLSVEYDVIASPAGTYADTLTLPDLDTWVPPDPDAPVEALTGMAHTVRFSTYTDGSIREFVDLTWDKPESRVTTRIRFRPVGRLIGTDRINASTSVTSWTGPIGTNIAPVTGQDVIDSLNPPDDLPDWRERTTELPRMTLGPDDDVDFPLIFAIQGRHELNGNAGPWSAEMLVEVNGPTMPGTLDTWAAAVEGEVVVLTANPVNARDVAAVEYTVSWAANPTDTPPAAAPHTADNIVSVAITPGAPIRIRHVPSLGAGQYVFAGRIVDKASNVSAVATARAVVSTVGGGDHVPIETDATDADAGIVGRVYMRPLIGTPQNLRVRAIGPEPRWDWTLTVSGDRVDGYELNWRVKGNQQWSTASTTHRDYDFDPTPGLTYQVRVRAKVGMETGWWSDTIELTG